MAWTYGIGPILGCVHGQPLIRPLSMPRGIRRATMRAALFLCLALLLIGCGFNESSPNLLSVAAISARYVDVGDRIELLGAGFPEGRTATITFAGDLFRPGQHTIRGVKIVAPSVGGSHDRLALLVTPELQKAFCGSGNGAEHTTFRGDAIVAFAPRLAGSPPVTGVLHGVVLDVEAPLPKRLEIAQRERTAQRALEFLGMQLESDSSSGKLRVLSLAKGGRAERAGLIVGDVLVSVDGVNTYVLTDVVPARGGRNATLAVRRGKLPDPLYRTVDVAGFHTLAPTELAPTAILVTGFLLFLFASRSIVGRVVCAVVRTFSQQLNAIDPWTGPVERAFRRQLRRPTEPAFARVAPHLVFVAVSGATTALSFGQFVVSPDLDLCLALLVTSTFSLCITVVFGATERARAGSLRRGLSRSLASLAHHLVRWLSVVTVVVSSGSIRVQELVAAQGVWPWQWNLFRTPLLLLAFLLFVLSLVPRLDAAGPLARGGKPRMASLLSFCEWTELLVMSSLGSLLFLGGFRVPLVGVAEQPSVIPAAVAGAVLVQLKCWAIVSLVLVGRWLLPNTGVVHSAAVCWRWGVPLAATAALATFGWVAALRWTLLEQLQSGFSLALFVGCIALVCAVAAEIRAQARSGAGASGVSPWL